MTVLSASDEPVRELHPTARCHDAAHGRHRAVRNPVLSATAGQRPPERRLPRHQRASEPAGGQSADGRRRGRHATGEAVLHDRGPRDDDLEQHAGWHQHHAAVRARSGHRCGGPGRPGGDRPDASPATPGHAAAVLRQVESGRLPHPVHGAHQRRAAPSRAGRVCADDAGATALDRRGRRTGAGVRVAEVRGAHPARPPAPRVEGHRHRPGLGRHLERERQPADRSALRARQGLHPEHRRPARECPRIQAVSDQGPGWRTRSTRRPGPGGGWHAGQPDRQLVQW